MLPSTPVQARTRGEVIAGNNIALKWKKEGGGSDVAAFLFASRIKSLETDEGGDIIKKMKKNARGLAYVEKNE